jgi:hypothetical protein
MAWAATEDQNTVTNMPSGPKLKTVDIIVNSGKQHNYAASDILRR